MSNFVPVESTCVFLITSSTYVNTQSSETSIINAQVEYPGKKSCRQLRRWEIVSYVQFNYLTEVTKKTEGPQVASDVDVTIKSSSE